MHLPYLLMNESENEAKNECTYHITPHATPLQGQGQSSANFSASLEWTLLEIKSSYISALDSYISNVIGLQFSRYEFE